MYDDATPGVCHTKCLISPESQQHLKNAKDLWKTIQNEQAQQQMQMDKAQGLKDSLVGNTSDAKSVANSDTANLLSSIFSALTLDTSGGAAGATATALSTGGTAATTAGQIAQDLSNGGGSDSSDPLGNSFDTNIGNIGNLLNSVGSLAGDAVVAGAGAFTGLVGSADQFFKDFSQYQSGMQDLDQTNQFIRRDLDQFNAEMQVAALESDKCPDPPGVLDVFGAAKIAGKCAGQWDGLPGLPFPSTTGSFIGLQAQFDALAHFRADLAAVQALSRSTPRKQAIAMLQSLQASAGAFSQLMNLHDQVQSFTGQLSTASDTFFSANQSAINGCPGADFVDSVATSGPMAGAIVSTPDGVFGAVTGADGTAILPLAKPGGTYTLNVSLPGTSFATQITGQVPMKPPKLLDVGDAVLNPYGQSASGSGGPALTPTPAPQPPGSTGGVGDEALGASLLVDPADNTWLVSPQLSAGASQLVFSRASDTQSSLGLVTEFQYPLGGTLPEPGVTFGSDGTLYDAFDMLSERVTGNPMMPVALQESISYASLPPGGSQFAPAMEVSADGLVGGQLGGAADAAVLPGSPLSVAWFGAGASGSLSLVASTQSAAGFSPAQIVSGGPKALLYAFDPEGTVYRVSSGSAGLLQVATSRDGLHFNADAAVAGFASANSLLISFGPARTVLLYKMAPTDAGAMNAGTDLTWTLSSDGGQSFSKAQTVRVAGKFFSAGQIVPDGHGGFAGAVTADSSQAPLFVLRSKDGRTWSVSSPVGVGVLPPSTAIDARGNATFAWVEPVMMPITLPPGVTLPPGTTLPEVPVPVLKVARTTLDALG